LLVFTSYQELQEHEQQEAIRAEAASSARAVAEEAQRGTDELRHQLDRLQVRGELELFGQEFVHR
jgi:hypothetical protein